MSTSDRSDITKWSGSNKKSESHSSSSPKRLRSTYLTRNSIDEIEVSSSSSEQNNNSSKTNLLASTLRFFFIIYRLVNLI